jgi:hypothetical protein
MEVENGHAEEEVREEESSEGGEEVDEEAVDGEEESEDSEEDEDEGEPAFSQVDFLENLMKTIDDKQNPDEEEFQIF